VLLASGAAAQTYPLSPQEIEVRLGLSPEESAALLDSMVPTDAGPVYYQLFMQFTPALEAAYHYYDGSVLDDDIRTEVANLTGITPEQAAQELDNAQKLIEQLVWASRLDRCDFGLMYQEGWSVLLPHLGKMRSASRILRSDAWRKLDAGEADAAADRLAAIYDMSRQVSRDRVLISSLVGMAMAAHAHVLTNRALEERSLTDAGRDALIAALERFEPDDPFNARECVKMEGVVSLGWLAKEFGDGPDAGARFLNLTPGMGAVLEPAPTNGAPSDAVAHDPSAIENRIRHLDGAGLVAEARRLTPLYEQAVAAWELPDASDRLNALSALVEVGAFGDLGSIFAPALGHVHATDTKAQRELAETLTALQAYRAPETDAAQDGAHDPD
jgi:hypothetical protein